MRYMMIASVAVATEEGRGSAAEELDVTLIEILALAAVAVAAIIILLVTQSKHRAAWPAWVVPAILVVPLAVITVPAIAQGGILGFWANHTTSWWGLQVWTDLVMAVAAAFFLLQNRARAAGMKSEVWVILVLATGSIGLFLMLARTLYLERRAASA